MRAALGARDGVDLVDDDGVHVAQRLAGRGREHEEQRLGRGDEHVGRVGGQPPAFLLRGVAGADADADVDDGLAFAGRGAGDADQGRAEVALDVDGQGLERRDVEHRGAARRRVGCAGLAVQQAVDRAEERGEGLARAGGRHDQQVPVVGRGPGGRLSGCGLAKALAEPRTGGRRESVERVGHPDIVAATTDTARRTGLPEGAVSQPPNEDHAGVGGEFSTV